jgi:putative transposase
VHYVGAFSVVSIVAPEGYKSNYDVVYSGHYHVVWTPKYRQACWSDRLRNAANSCFDKWQQNIKTEITALEIMPDHVHVLVDVDPQFGIHRLVKNLKGVSSHRLRPEFRTLRSRLPTLWTNSYFVSTVGGARLAVIEQYVENQKNV